MDSDVTNIEEEIQVRLKSGAFSSREQLLRCALNALDEQVRFESLLAEGLNSGNPIEATPEFWNERRRALRRKMDAEQ